MVEIQWILDPDCVVETRMVKPHGQITLKCLVFFNVLHYLVVLDVQ